MSIEFTVNGAPVVVPDDRAGDKLIDVLHEELNLTGTKFCCGIGVCRACTVAVRHAGGPVRQPVIACSTAVSLLDGAEVTTVEGVADGTLHPLQVAFLENFSFQCGYCTPGFLMGALAFLDQLRVTPVPRDRLDQAIEDAMNTHICRCSGYKRYIDAIRQVALTQMEDAQ
ncbi:(2Fe-2S)-binding protein [Halovulum sp. GXIMD14793]